MSLHLNATIPHITDVEHTADLLDWGQHQTPIDGRSLNRGRLLFKGEDGLPEAGLWRSTPGSWRLVLPADELCYFVSGHARYVADTGETIEATPGTLIHFNEGWRGRVEVLDEILVTYMLAHGGPRSATKVIRDPATAQLEDWGPAKTVDGRPASFSGIEISKEPDGRAESGLWECGPAIRAVTIPRDEFCHFLAGHALYTHESGDRIEVKPGTIIFLPGGWTGTCETFATTRKIYMNR